MTHVIGSLVFSQKLSVNETRGGRILVETRGSRILIGETRGGRILIGETRLGGRILISFENLEKSSKNRRFFTHFAKFLPAALLSVPAALSRPIWLRCAAGGLVL